MTPTEESAFRPRSLAILGPDGRRVRGMGPFRDGTAIGALVRLAPGDYAVRVRGREASTGGFLVQVHLVGDVDGDRRVELEDVAAIRAARGPHGVGATVAGSAFLHHDVDRDGRVGPRDVLRARLNRDAEGTTIQYLIRDSTGGVADGDIHVAFYGQDADAGTASRAITTSTRSSPGRPPGDTSITSPWTRPPTGSRSRAAT